MSRQTFGIAGTICRTLTGIAFTGLALAQNGTRPESLLPADTMLFFGTDDLEALRASAADSPMGRVMSEPEVQEFLAQPLAELKKAIDMGVAAAKQHPALAELKLDFEKIKAAPFGRGFVAITHLDLPPEMVKDPSRADLGFVVGLEPRGNFDAIGTLKQVIQSLAVAEGGEDVTMDSITIDGLAVDRLKAKDAPFALCFANIGGISVFSLSERSITAMARCASGAQPSLATTPDYVRSAAAAGAAGKGDLATFVRLGQMMKVVRSAIELGAAASEQDGSGADKDDKQLLALMRSALDAFNFEAFGPAYSLMTRKDGVAVTTSYTEIDSSAGGIAALTKPAPIDRELLKLVPKNALSFSLSHFDLSALWDMATETLAKAAPEMHAQAMGAIRNAEALVAGADEQGNPQWDMRRDLIGALSGRTMSMGIPGAGSLLGPGSDTVFWIETPNAAGLEKSLGYLFALPGQLANFPINWKEQLHGEAKLKVLDPMSLGPAAMMAGQLALTYSIFDGKFWFSTSTKALKKALDARSAPPAENITARADFAKHFVEPPAGAVLTGLSYSDTAASFENTYTQLLGIVPMAMMGLQQQGAPELPIDVALLPTAEAISKHLFGSVGMSYTVGNGRVTVSRSPFGAETMVGMATGISLASILFVGRVQEASMGGLLTSPREVAKPSAAPADVVRSDFAKLSTAITVYMIEYNVPPESLNVLTQPKPEYPEGFLNGASVPTDPWGQAYSYANDGKEHYTIWSLGPNGVDDKGAGDDIVQRG
ncbi:MAG: hypothetical protein EXS13_07770 [Planctomycetes bacterium]|nr:hypothetical protein [Planctomycetota bacterium]